MIDSVTDNEILQAYRLLAAQVGIFAEPASAAALAGLIKHVKRGLDPRGKTVVCVLTGHGLKDPDAAVGCASSMTEVPADSRLVEEAIGLR